MARALVPLVLGMALLASLPAAAQDLQLVTAASGLSSPLWVGSPANDPRLFILEQNTARVRIQQPGGGNPTTFLDLNSLAGANGERGLLGLAFAPDYAASGHFYVNYTDNGGDTVVARYTVSGNPDVADPNSALIILTLNQPYSNHNGGALAFGSDDMLYIGTGDGGSGGDPGNRAQNPQELLGKMLRIDVSNAAVGNPYDIPPDNPFVGDGSTLDEIWALGLRNPWRFTFDRVDGTMWIGDVGQNQWEEVHREPAGAGGRNYGWRLMEGLHCYNPGVNCDPGGLTYPIWEYSHGLGCSVTGGNVYRGDQMPWLDGSYFYGDYCSRRVWTLDFDGQVNNVERTSEIGPGGSLTSFGEDADGEVYIVAGSSVYHITTVLQLTTTPMIAGQSFDMNIEGASPGETVWVAYSLDGIGETPIPARNVTLSLLNPGLAGSVTADNGGNAQLSRNLPISVQGRDVWLQAVVQDNISNVSSTTIQ